MYNLLAYQILSHLSIFYVIWFFNIYLLIGSIITYFVFITFGISAGYHRLLSHRSFQSPTWFKFITLLIGTLGLNASGLVWAAMHRQHHAYSDTEDDPHSPTFMGFLKTYFGIVTYQPKLTFAKDLLRDKLVMFFHKKYFLVNIVYDILLFLIEPSFIIWFHLFPATLLWHATAAINYFSHIDWFGYRNYETKDHSRNSTLLAVLVSGEGYHNNHHKDPKNFNFAHNNNEFDITGFILKIFKR